MNLIYKNISEQYKRTLFVALEVALLFICSNILLNDLVPFMQRNISFRQLGLENIICFTGDSLDISDYNFELVTMLGQNLVGQPAESSTISDISIKPVSYEYLENIKYKTYKRTADYKGIENPAFITKYLASIFHINQTYTLYNHANQPIRFTVVAILNSNNLFLPPTDDNPSSLLRNNSQTILLVPNVDTQQYFKESNIFTMLAETEQSKEAAISELKAMDSVSFVLSGTDAKKYSDDLSLEVMGLPIIVFIMVLVLSYAGFSSHILLSIQERERLYAVYYLCGATWRKCLLIQAVTDGFTFLVPIIISLILIVIGHFCSVISKFNIYSITISLFIIVIIFIASSLSGFFHILRKSSADIIGRES